MRQLKRCGVHLKLEKLSFEGIVMEKMSMKGKDSSCEENTDDLTVGEVER